MKQFKLRLTIAMIIDFGGCYIIEKGCKYLFADLEPREMVTRGRERREKRRAEELKIKAADDLKELADKMEVEIKKSQ